MSLRLPVAIPYMRWANGQNVSQEDLQTEQDYVINSNNSLVNNFFGSGVVPSTLQRLTILDSEAVRYAYDPVFDGRGIPPTNQPTDTNYGNQLEITLTDSNVSIRNSVKLCIIGTDFEDNIQYELFYFHVNETQISKKHFKTIFTFLFNDFLGNPGNDGNGCSLNLGGRIVIKEALQGFLSRDTLANSQNQEPNLFFRDFKCARLNDVDPNLTTVLNNTIQNALDSVSSGFTVDALNINTGYSDIKTLGSGDITTKYGQKFLANSNNIQNVRVLLGANNHSNTQTKDYSWSGDLVVSIYKLQTSVSCPSDTIPGEPINYEPYPSAIVQVIINQQSLLNSGITLTDIAQPIDINFTNTKVASGSIIVPDTYYMVSIQRVGDASVGDIFTLLGGNYSSQALFSEFDGTSWVDDTAYDMWFEIYSNNLKVTDCIAYDSGTGIQINKTTTDSTGATIDYCEDAIPLANSSVINYVLLQAVNEAIDPVQDEITGDERYSRYINSAQVSTVVSGQLATLTVNELPIILGSAKDINTKTSVTLLKPQNYPALCKGNTFQIINPDSSLLQYNLIGSKFTPDSNNINSKTYLVYKAILCVDGYGDLNGDGIVNETDLALIYPLIGKNITDPIVQGQILAGTVDLLQFLRADINGNGIIDQSDYDAVANYVYGRNATGFIHGANFNRLTLYVENLYGRNDTYFEAGDGFILWYDRVKYQFTNPSGIDYISIPSTDFVYYGYPIAVDIFSNDSTYVSSPFVSKTYKLDITPNWYEYLVKTTYAARAIPCSFGIIESGQTTHSSTTSLCTILNSSAPSCDGGRVDFYVPSNLVIGDAGELLRPDGTYYPIDYETNTITLTLPESVLNSYAVNIFDTFIAEQSSTPGKTAKGFNAMKFADSTYVQTDALANNQVRFSASIQSITKHTEGLDIALTDNDGYGVIVDPMFCIYIDQATGNLTILSSNISTSTNFISNSRIVVSIMLKKGGWKNNPISLTGDEVAGLWHS